MSNRYGSDVSYEELLERLLHLSPVEQFRFYVSLRESKSAKKDSLSSFENEYQSSRNDMD